MRFDIFMVFHISCIFTVCFFLFTLLFSLVVCLFLYFIFEPWNFFFGMNILLAILSFELTSCISGFLIPTSFKFDLSSMFYMFIEFVFQMLDCLCHSYLVLQFSGPSFRNLCSLCSLSCFCVFRLLKFLDQIYASFFFLFCFVLFGVALYYLCSEVHLSNSHQWTIFCTWGLSGDEILLWSFILYTEYIFQWDLDLWTSPFSSMSDMNTSGCTIEKHVQARISPNVWYDINRR